MKTTVIIQNLKCGGCAHSITTKLKALKTISKVEVDAETSSVTVEYRSREDMQLVKAELLSLGYPVEGDSNSFMTKAKSFVSCASGKLTN